MKNMIKNIKDMGRVEKTMIIVASILIVIGIVGLISSVTLAITGHIITTEDTTIVPIITPIVHLILTI